MESKKVGEHYQKHTITEIEHIPEHDERKETLEFRNAKHELEKVEHLGCFVCGTMNKRESHHIFERCWGNAYDFSKVAYFLYTNFDFHGHCHRDFGKWEDLLDYFITHFNGKPFEYVVELPGGVSETKTGYTCDDDALDTIYNQLILGYEHHREEGLSAHGATFASFVSSLAHKSGFQTLIDPKEYEKMVQQHHTEKYGGSA